MQEKNGYEKISDEQHRAACDVSLIDYCNHIGLQTAHFSGDTHMIVDMDSLKIWDGGKRWKRHSERTGQLGKYTGGSTINFVQEYEGLDYREAVFTLLHFSNSPLLPEWYRPSIRHTLDNYTRLRKMLLDEQKKNAQTQARAQQQNQNTAPAPSEQPQPEQTKNKQPYYSRTKKKGVFELPLHSKNNDKVLAYLIKTRHIDKEIVAYFIKNNYLYQDVYGNCVFIGYNDENKAAYAALRGTFTFGNAKFKGEVDASKKEHSFAFTPNKKSNILRVHESAIEVLSHMTLDKMNGLDWRAVHYKSCGGLAHAPIYSYLNKHPEIQVMELCVNDDIAGNNRVEKFKSMFAKHKVEIVRKPPQNGDYNQDLTDICQKKTQCLNEVAR
jgi:hypothetical protein